MDKRYQNFCDVCLFRDGENEHPCSICAWDRNPASYPSMFEYHHKEPVIKDSGQRTEFESGAVRDMQEGKGRCDLLPMCVLLRLARHYENGCKKYGDRNWEKGIPCHSFADSALRHLFKYLDGWDDEDHLIAAIWNLCGLAWTEEKKPELMDIPAVLQAWIDADKQTPPI